MNEQRPQLFEIQKDHEQRPVGVGLRSYMSGVLSEPNNQSLQRNPFVNRPWGAVLSEFTRDLDVRIQKAQDVDSLTGIISPLVTRGVELVSGGVVSSRDLPEGARRGLSEGGELAASTRRRILEFTQ